MPVSSCQLDHMYRVQQEGAEFLFLHQAELSGQLGLEDAAPTLDALRQRGKKD